MGDACEDTCCKGWGMQLTQETVDKYKAEAPELLDAVTSGEAEHIMKRDEKTDYCVKYDKGWCGIHASRGTNFLGDACHFFPRVTRQMGERNFMTASLSCPEVVRLAVFGETPFELHVTETERLPFSLRDYLPDTMEELHAWQTHRAFVEGVAEQGLAPERAIGRLRTIVDSLARVDEATWHQAVPFYMKSADALARPVEPHPADAFNLLNALQGLIGASKQTNRPRLDETIADIEAALKVKLNWETLGIELSPESEAAYKDMVAQWKEQYAAQFAPVLTQWLQAQLSINLFPFAGLGEDMQARVTILGVRFATVKLALMSACAVKGEAIDEAQTVRIIQSLARFLDHLADPTLSLQIYAETGWVKEARLRALIGE